MLDCGAYSSVKPGIPLSQQLEQVLVLRSQVHDDGPLLRDTQYMHADKVVEHPPGSGRLGGLAFLVRKRGAMVLECGANAGLSGRIYSQTPRHNHEERHHALRLFERPRGGQKLGVFQKTAAPLRLTLAFVTVEELLGG